MDFEIKLYCVKHSIKISLKHDTNKLKKLIIFKFKLYKK